MPNKFDETDDDRTVTVTVRELKAFEAAMFARMNAQLKVMRAADAVVAANNAHKKAHDEESAAIDAALAATEALHKGKP